MTSYPKPDTPEEEAAMLENLRLDELLRGGEIVEVRAFETPERTALRHLVRAVAYLMDAGVLDAQEIRENGGGQLADDLESALRDAAQVL